MLTCIGILCTIAVVAQSTSRTQFINDEDVLLVTNTFDEGVGSLREAIKQANTVAGPNRIEFAIPADDPGYDSDKGSFIVYLSEPLDAITDDSLVIDGRTQPAFLGLSENQHQPLVHLDGINTPEGSVGLSVLASDVEIHDLIVGRFYDGIFIYGQEHVLISGCYIGVGPTGKDAEPNYVGIHLLNAHHNMIVGLQGHPNLVSGNRNVGIFMQDSSHHNSIVKNIIGISRDSQLIVENELAGIAIQENSEFNFIVENLIGGSKNGIQITGGNYNEIGSNLIGTTSGFDKNFSNNETGILIYSNNNLIVDNTIGYNLKYGVQISGGKFNRITANRMAFNGEKAIRCQGGGNNELNPPSISKFENQILKGIAIDGQLVEIFFDTLDQCLLFYGIFPIDENGRFEVPIEDESFQRYAVTATAIDSLGNTSEVSSAFSLITPTYDLTQNALSIDLYPNPAREIIHIALVLPEAQRVSLDLVNQRGQKVYSTEYQWMDQGFNSLTWDLSFAPEKQLSGLYYVRVISKNTVISKRIAIFP